MNDMTSRQRKLTYLLAIAFLLIPIVFLGLPSAGRPGTGGYLARLRTDYDLGESDLGDVDPSSATMNLVLLGLRGVAANILWMEHEEYKKTKDWAQMRASTESIIRLQPHFIKVWQYHGWDLAYNVSAEWDGVKDRYYWVKEGGKFLIRGTERNRSTPELPHEAGRVFGQKIGRADEWKFFREFFKSDPAERFNGGPDPAINQEGRDNYLVARDWYTLANENELTAEQKIMARVLFRSYPARSLMDYGQALQREGVFDEVAANAWAQAFEEWTQKYGQETFIAGFDNELEIRLELTGDDIKDFADSPEEEIAVKDWVDRYQKMTNYRYWRTRALAEAEADTVDAHREIYEGGEEFKAFRLQEAQKLLESGMAKLDSVFKRYPTLGAEDLMIEEGIMAVLLWQYIHQLNEEQPPADFPLRDLWEREQARVPMIDEQFQRQYLR